MHVCNVCLDVMYVMSLCIVCACMSLISVAVYVMCVCMECL